MTRRQFETLLTIMFAMIRAYDAQLGTPDQLAEARKERDDLIESFRRALGELKDQ